MHYISEVLGHHSIDFTRKHYARFSPDSASKNVLPVLEGRKINFSRVFAGQYVGVTGIDNDIWLVSLMDYDLGFFDNEVNRVEPVSENPFAPKVLPMSPV
jgi:hypothetical protein